MIQNNIESVLKKHSIIPVVTITDLSEIDFTISTLLSKEALVEIKEEDKVSILQ